MKALLASLAFSLATAPAAGQAASGIDLLIPLCGGGFARLHIPAPDGERRPGAPPCHMAIACTDVRLRCRAGADGARI